eukprot:m.65637 g.65637  ORF g.65637 m.65637 type:complete len:802 (-) comp7344_c0_seq1:118-2523(-)
MEVLREVASVLGEVLRSLPGQSCDADLGLLPAASIEDIATPPAQRDTVTSLKWCIRVLQTAARDGLGPSGSDSWQGSVPDPRQEQLVKEVAMLSQGNAPDHAVAEFIGGNFLDSQKMEAKRLSQSKFRRSVAKGDPRRMRSFTTPHFNSNSSSPISDYYRSNSMPFRQQSQDSMGVPDGLVHAPGLQDISEEPDDQFLNASYRSLDSRPGSMRNMLSPFSGSEISFLDGSASLTRDGSRLSLNGSTAEFQPSAEAEPVSTSGINADGKPEVVIVDPRDSSATEEAEAQHRSSVDGCGDLLSVPPSERDAIRTRLAVSFIARMSSFPSGKPLAPGPECSDLLKNIDSWEFDVFRLEALTGGRPLATLAMKIMHDRGLIEQLRLDAEALTNFFVAIEDSYKRHPAVPYHNNLHAADVMHGVHVLLDTDVFLEAFSYLEIFATLIAGAIHDVDHPGRTNAFLIKTNDELAVRYNDASVLENHHLATAFQVMQRPGCNIMADFDKGEQKVFRRLLIQMVLGTDMTKHTKCVTELVGFRDHVYTAARKSVEGRRSEVAAAEQHEEPHGQHEVAVDDVSLAIKTRLTDNADERALVLSNIVHMSDLSSASKPWYLAVRWTDRIINEFLNEGDDERRMNLEVGAMNDRKSMVIPKAQIGFINFIAKPLWEIWSSIVSPTGETLQIEFLKGNLDEWVRRASEHDATTTGAAARRVSHGAIASHSSPSSPQAGSRCLTPDEAAASTNPQSPQSPRSPLSVRAQRARSNATAAAGSHSPKAPLSRRGAQKGRRRAAEGRDSDSEEDVETIV